MIKINSLIKIYKSKDNQQTAINNISLTLPSSGMVFITGESGSGKSTLLNLIGGLDSISYGEIIVDGNNLAKLSEKELVNYRSSYLGFIFQDYSLIKDFTVYKNVKLSLDIVGDTNYSKVDEVLEKVGLTNYKTRHPSQLSGGQCQRAAIARAIVKEPKIILCDEPTGNLDSENSRQVLDILRKLSEDKLIIIVSHNIDDAKHYADRIIELKDGEVISDYHNDLQNNYLIENNTLFVGNISKLSNEELSNINANIGVIKEIKPLNRLSSTVEVNEEPKNEKFKNSKFKQLIKSAGTFLKHNLVAVSLISLFSGVLVATQGMTQNLTSFKASEVIQQTMVQNKASTLVMKKNFMNSSGKVKTNYVNRVTDKDKELINKSKYKDEYYELINYSLPISLTTSNLCKQISVTNTNNLKNLYPCESYGVLVTDTDYVKTLFGKYELSAEDSVKPNYGIYITDFIADSIMHYQTGYGSYSDLLGTYSYTMGDQDTGAYINGIIKTGYKSKYGSLIDEYTQAMSDGDTTTIDRIQDSDKYVELVDKITSIYGIGYSFNSNFLNDCRNIKCRTFTRLDRVKVEGTVIGKKQQIAITYANAHQATNSGYAAPERTILMTTGAINSLLGTKYTTTELRLLLPLKGTITGYSAVAQATNDINNYEYRISAQIDLREDAEKIGTTKNYYYILSDDLFETIQEKTIFPYALYFKNVKHTAGIYNLLSNVPFSPTSPYASSAATVGNTVEAYNSVFVLVAVLLAVIAFSLIVVFSVSIITKYKHDIGILKALGAKDFDIAKIFISQVGVIAVSASLVSLLVGLLLTKRMDQILLKVINKIMGSANFFLVEILTINPSVLILDIVLIIAFSIVGAIIPLLMLKKIKPMQIIRNNK